MMTGHELTRSLCAGTAYFAAVFAAGFMLGTVRVGLTAPRLGETSAVLLELPIMLAVSWWACRKATAGSPLAGAAARSVMGASAFALLMIAEAALTLATGRTLADFVHHLATPAGALGLSGQVAFALMPWLQRPAHRT